MSDLSMRRDPRFGMSRASRCGRSSSWSASISWDFIRTVRKSYLRPREESTIMFSIDACKFVISIFALESYSVTSVLYPIVATRVNGGLVAMILWRRASLKK